MKHRFFILVKLPNQFPKVIGKDVFRSMESAKLHLDKITTSLPNGTLVVIAKDVERYEINTIKVRCNK